MLQRIRLYSGLLLLAFATTHLINHAFGLISLQAMEGARQTLLGFWHTEPFNLVVLTALIVHTIVSLMIVARQRTAKLAWWQVAQIVSGTIIPVLLAGHILGTMALQGAHDFRVDYYFVMPLLWPSAAERQILMSLLVWAHGLAGLHFWLRQKPWYGHWQPGVLAFGLLLPTLSMAGFVAGGRDLQRQMALDSDLTRKWAERFDWPGWSDMIWIWSAERNTVIAFALLLLAFTGWRVARDIADRRRNRIVVTFDDGSMVRVPPGYSILDASRSGGVTHASVCGGRGRCSTCRVRLNDGLANVLPAGPDERRVLDRLGAMTDVRLACQARLAASVRVTRLMPPDTGPGDSLKPMDPSQGVEREIVVLFADLRSFTQLAETRLPYDTVHVLNSYFRIMGEAIEIHHGRIDKFIGDGIMALFGLHQTPAQAAQSALTAAAAMRRGLETLNGRFSADLEQPLRMGIGLHLGPAIVGEMGYGRASSMTAIGDTVNTASRLESATKELGAELIVSQTLLERSGFGGDIGGSGGELHLRGRRQAMAVRYWAQGERLRIAESPANVGRTPWYARLLAGLRPAG